MMTPCTRVCSIDTATGLCVGCGRTRDEIASWASLAPEERAALMIELPLRLQIPSSSPLPVSGTPDAPLTVRQGRAG
ncbi:DUF1289 domain-containing protein [Rhizobium sp. SSA_523]|uniref:DUF1289 domain-containing protein n=1 Tax=Rhizobium sp. SSA_523 TaxID=2952477 RepID=UPI0020915834|nr:DUF1289 domain-containing protein [Rhizobium sp. SSA_523]MCO5730041.1 DUF1289 domain-containing protein [Rhizobium sp. SSA_523]WKC25109.1 DUF1289 domain-containing protein [Rhizobium sp. SSA_523]